MPDPETVIRVIQEMQPLLLHNEQCPPSRIPMTLCECQLKGVVERSDALIRACVAELALADKMSEQPRFSPGGLQLKDEEKPTTYLDITGQEMISLACEIRVSRTRLRDLLKGAL